MASALDIIIRAQNRASGDFRRLRRDLEALRQAGSNMREVGSHFLFMGGAIAGGLGYAVKTAADFEQAIAQVASVMGRTAGDWKDIEQVAREYGKTTTYTATESAQAMKLVAQYGYDVSDSLKIMATTTKLATGQQYDLALATDLVISTMKVYERHGYSAARVADIFAKASNISSASMDKFKYSMKYVAPVASSLDVPLENLTAQLALLYDSGLTAETAGTTLRMAYQRLLNPTKKATDALKKYGITIDDISPRTKDMADILDTLKKAGVDASDMFTIFGVESGPGMMAMLDKGGDALRRYQEQLRNAGGTVEQMYDTQMATFNNKLKLLESQFQELAISIGQALIPTMERLISILSKAADWFNGLSQSNKELIANLMLGATALFFLAGVVLYLGGAFVTAMAAWRQFVALVKNISRIAGLIRYLRSLGSILMRLRSILTWVRLGWAALGAAISGTGPIGWGILALIAILTLLYYAWKNNWFGIKDILNTVWNWIVQKLTSLVKKQIEIINQIVKWWGSFSLLDTLRGAWEGVVEWVAGIWQSIKDTVYEFLKGILMDTGQTAEEAEETLRKAWNNIKMVFKNALNLIYDITIGNWIEIGQKIWELMQWIWDTVQAGWEKLRAWLAPYWEAVKQIFSNALEWIRINFYQHIEPIVQFFIQRFNEIRVFAVEVWGVIRQVVSDALNAIWGRIQSQLAFIKNIWNSYWNAIRQSIAVTWNVIKNIVSNETNNMKQIIALALNILAGQWDKAWENIKNIAKNRLDNVRVIVQGAIKNILRVFQVSSQDAERAGRALMDAFARGVRSAASRVTGAVQSVMSQARRYFGFSDAKEGPFSNITQSGYATMSAFAKGASQARSLLAKNVGGTLSSALSGATAGVYGIGQVGRLTAVGTPGPAPEQTFNITINVQGGDMDEQRLAAIVIEEIQKAMRR